MISTTPQVFLKDEIMDFKNVGESQVTSYEVDAGISMEDYAGLTGDQHEDAKILFAIDEYNKVVATARTAKSQLSSSAHGSELKFGLVDVASCFTRVCRGSGVQTPSLCHSVMELRDDQVAQLASKNKFKVFFTAYSKDDPRNHIELVSKDTVNTKVNVAPLTGPPSQRRMVVCTTMQHFFNKSNEWKDYKFYMDEELFGGDSANRQNYAADRAQTGPQSIVGESVHGGGSNVSSGVTRSKRRNISAKSNALGGGVAKNYRATNAVLFNNADEMFQDKISREYAQEIIEELFEVWGVPLDQPEAAKYAEDVLWTFLIAVTASNKADYNRSFDVPVKPVRRGGEMVSSVEADFSKFSLLLESKFGVTRRQFSRGVADDLRGFLRLEENQSLLPPLATRVGCETFLAYLAFDGSTHCTNLTTREVTFTKTLESRNLFERDDVVAQGASDKLMQGMSGGIRSVAPR